MKYKAQQITYITKSVKGVPPEKDIADIPKVNYYIRIKVKGQTLYLHESGNWVDFNSATKFKERPAKNLLNKLKKHYKSASLFTSTI